jgi:hypothetical protein
MFALVLPTLRTTALDGRTNATKTNKKIGLNSLSAV